MTSRPPDPRPPAAAGAPLRDRAGAGDAAPGGSAAPPVAAPKNGGGIGRIARAAACSWAGLRAAWRHEAAFRQELALGVPLLAAGLWLAPGRWQALALVAPVLAVWVVELLNSAVEALADAVSLEHRPLLGRAKDLGSAAVMLTLLTVPLAWAVVFWP